MIRETFDQRLKQLYFDTALYNVESLKLLFRIVGPERCLFGTERPGRRFQDRSTHRQMVRRCAAEYRKHPVAQGGGQRENFSKERRAGVLEIQDVIGYPKSVIPACFKRESCARESATSAW